MSKEGKNSSSGAKAASSAVGQEPAQDVEKVSTYFNQLAVYVSTLPVILDRKRECYGLEVSV